MDDIETGTEYISDSIDELNRRIEPRIPFMGMRLKVRKRGVTKLRRYVECYSIDLSNSGLAFSTNQLILSELEKVDFILTFQNQTIHGVALVRYTQISDETKQYGLMFLQAVPELDNVLGAEHLTTQEITSLAGSMAEQVAYSIQEKQDKNLRLRRQQQRFLDALHAYFERLGQMHVQIPDVNSPDDRWTTADKAVEIDEQKNTIRFILYRPDHDEFQEEMIYASAINSDNMLEFKSSSGDSFRTVFEVLSYISDEISLVAKFAHLYYDVPAHHQTD